ncbi:MAG: radical SAM protein [Candidatus Omnitrophica bacterium]|nr:radical SAM protein [Candidatus Omnitrophota bacterium]
MKAKNRFLLNKDYLRKKAVVSGFPTELTIEITNHCNLDCIFCPRSKMKRPKGFMDFRMFKGLVDQAKGYLELIDFDLMGETVLHPQIVEFVSYCRRSGIRTMLSSNMMLTDSKLVQELISAGLDMLTMDIDAATPQTYGVLRRGGDFGKVKQNIESVLGLGDRRLFKVIKMVYTALNKHEAGIFQEMWRGKGADYERLSPYENMDKQLLELNAVPENKRCGRRSPCVQLWRKFAVCWDGTAVACCDDYDKFSVLGDVNNDSIMDIWNGGPMVNLRRKHVSADLHTAPFCRECRLFEPSLLFILGSTFTDALTLRKVFFNFEKLLIRKNIAFFRHF